MERTRQPLLAPLLTWLLLAGLSATATANGSVVEDSCKMKDGSAGVCRSIKQCEAALGAIREGETPVTCSFNQSTPIVCCPTTVAAATTGAKATKMCSKYAEAVYIWERSPVLPTRPVIVKVDRCATTNVPFTLGGLEAQPNEFPHMALLGYESAQNPKWLCGGSLISDYYVLTAAHCLSSREGFPLVVRLGELNLNLDPEPLNQHVDYGVAELLAHPDFKPNAQYNDVGLVKLDRKVNFTRSIRPACLNVQPEIPDKIAIATGWESTSRGEGEPSDKLQVIKMQLVASEECIKVYEQSPRLKQGFLGESMICAGDLGGGKDTCPVNFDGPLQTKLENPYCMYNIIGITNFGKACGAKNSPGVYARVSYFLPWIESVVWSDEI